MENDTTEMISVPSETESVASETGFVPTDLISVGTEIKSLPSEMLSGITETAKHMLVTIHLRMSDRITGAELPDSSGKPVKRQTEEETRRQGARYKRTSAAADSQRIARTEDDKGDRADSA